MKKVMFLAIFLTVNAYAKKIVLDIPDKDIAVVENDVPDAEQWIKAAWAGKVNKSRDRMIQAEVSRSLNAKEGLPSTGDAIIAKAMSRSDYKNRKQRDAVELKADSTKRTK